MLAKTYYTHGNSKRKTSGDQTLRWWPRSACLIHSLVLSPSVRARVCNVLLIHRPWKWWQDTQYVNRTVLLACMIRLHEITTFVLLGEFLRGRHVEKITHQETDGGNRPTAGTNQRPSVWQHTRNQMLSTTSGAQRWICSQLNLRWYLNQGKHLDGSYERC